MTVEEILSQLEKLGSNQAKNIFFRHGAREPLYGVKVADLKKIQKVIKKDYNLSLKLYDTGNSDAMYLAGLIADETKITKEDLNNWVDKAYWYMLSGFTVPWVAAESRYGYELALEWIESSKEMTASAGWATLSNIISIEKDENLNLNKIASLLLRIEKEIHNEKNRVKYSMNNFVIAVGSYIKDLTDLSINIAEKIGKVHIDMGETSCSVPYAKEYILKVKTKGNIGKKRKRARC